MIKSNAASTIVIFAKTKKNDIDSIEPKTNIIIATKTKKTNILINNLYSIYFSSF